jgi:hypothetical protein
MSDFSARNMLVVGIGGILLWSGVKGVKASEALRSLLQGKDPHQLPVANPLDSTFGGATGTPGGTLSPSQGANTAMAMKNRGIARLIAASHGWATGNEWVALNNIVNAEDAGWDPHAENPSGAYGIPQALPGSKMASAGSDWRDNPATQLHWMIDMYIPQRYGTPSKAWSFHQANGTY